MKQANPCHAEKEDPSSSAYYKKVKTSDNKKLVKLSRMCKEYVQKLETTNGTEIANIILEQQRKEKDEEFDFKNVQRRVYDALNVFSALGIVEKKRNIIVYKGESDISKPANQPPKELVDAVNRQKNAIKCKRLKLMCKLKEYYALQKLIKRNSKSFANIEVLGKVKLPVKLISFKNGSKFSVSHSPCKRSVHIKSNNHPKIINKVSDIFIPDLNLQK